MKNLTLIDRLPADLDEQVHEQIARGGLWTAYSLGRPGGMKAIDSPYEPRGEVRRSLLRSEAWPGRATLVLGAGSGYFARVIAEEDLAPALLVTASRALLRCNEKRLTKQLPDNDADLTIVADHDPERVWNEHIAPFLSAHADASITIHPRERAAFPGFYAALESRLLRWKSGQLRLPDKPAAVRRVLWVGAGALFEREMREAFGARGVEFETIRQDELAGITPEKALQLLDLTRPDLVLSTNNRGSDERGVLPAACEVAGVRWATWLLDEPRFLVHPSEQDVYRAPRTAFCWDRNGLDGWTDLGFDNAHLLPLATDEALFTPGSGRDELAGRLVFVGSPRFVRADGFFAALDPSPAARKAALALEAEIRRTRTLPDSERVDDVLATVDPDKTLAAEARRRLPGFAVQQANLAYRVQVLNDLADLRPVVFGQGWEGLLDERIEVRPPLDFYTDLPDVYRSDAVHLSLTNLQMRSHPNQRPFDVGACGRAVVMDRVSDLGDVFGADLATELSAPDTAGLRDRVEGLLRDGARRAELGGRLRERVLAGHTVRHRVDDLLERLAESPR